MSNHTPQSNVTTYVQEYQQQDIPKSLIMSQLEGPKKRRLGHPILDYSKSIIMTSEEYLQALGKKLGGKKKLPMSMKRKDKS
jgi:hypothetical protein